MEMRADDYGFGYVLGVNYQLHDDWNVALKYQSGIDLTLEGDVSFATGYPLAPADDSVSGGYVFDESPVNRDTVAPELPGNDRHMFMLGLGYKAEQWGVDVVYSYLYMRDSDVSGMTDSNSLGAAGLDPDGEYTDGQAHLLGVSFSYFF